MTRCSFLLLNAAALHTGMKDMTFKDWLAQQDEGLLLPDRPPRKGMPRINPFPTTDARRVRLRPSPVKKFKPTVQKVKEIVPNKLIPKLKPL